MRTDKGDEIHCRFLFLANGALSSPATPGIHISNEFKQRASHFHTHNFNHEIDYNKASVKELDQMIKKTKNEMQKMAKSLHFISL